MGKTIKDNAVERVSFPEDEAAHPWLSMLLDSYHILDEGIARSIEKEEEKGRQLACVKGCSACCISHVTVPIYPIELTGIAWYVTEKVRHPLREKILANLKNFKEGNGCPFVIDDDCSIYPIRPMACRQFNVFNKRCEEGEDAYHTRREDVLVPDDKATDKAFDATLPFYGAETRAQRRQVLKSKAIHTKATIMRTCKWPSLAEKMEKFEKENPEAFRD